MATDAGRLRAVALVAAAHLVLVALGALHVELSRGGPLGRALGEYAALTGADASYGFFAPGFDGELFATFEITEPGGRATTDVLETGASREADFRTRNIVGTFFLGDEAWRRALAASWAGKMMARHPDAESVMVNLASYDLPSMEEVRRGRPAGWATRYRARFVRRREGAP
jgi:hypothetical protein